MDTTSALFAPAVAYVTAPSGMSWRVRKLSLLDLPVDQRATGIAEILPLQAEVSAIGAAVAQARDALAEASRSGAELAQAAARDELETAQAAAAEKVRAVASRLGRDGGILSSLTERAAVTACAAVTGCVLAPERSPGPIPSAEAAALTWTPCELVRDASQDDREQMRSYVGRWESDLQAIAEAAKWEAAADLATFRGDGHRDRP